MKDRKEVVSLLFDRRKSQLANRVPIYGGNQDLYTAGPLPFKSNKFKVHFKQRNRYVVVLEITFMESFFCT